jgi:DNA-binding MarR family transcriptional regulator
LTVLYVVIIVPAVPALDGYPFPALLRDARRAYGRAVRGPLEEAGCGDMPLNGPFVLGAISTTGTPLADVIAALGLSKQAAGALVDALVVRGYLSREVDPADRRRLHVALTERGGYAAALVADAVGTVDARLREIVGDEAVSTSRDVLWELARCG